MQSILENVIGNEKVLRLVWKINSSGGNTGKTYCWTWVEKLSNVTSTKDWLSLAEHMERTGARLSVLLAQEAGLDADETVDFGLVQQFG